MKKLLSLILITFCFLIGCSCIRINKGIAIEDFILGSPYEIEAVDGKTPKRAEHCIVTVVPVVLVSEGKHILTVKRSLNKVTEAGISREVGLPIDIEVNLSESNRYRVIDNGGKPVLAIDE